MHKANTVLRNSSTEETDLTHSQKVSLQIPVKAQICKSQAQHFEINPDL